MQAPRPLAPLPIAEHTARASASGRIAFGALVALLLTGLWVRFNDTIASVVPFLAAPGSAAAAQPIGLLELALLPRSEELAAVAAMGLPAAQSATLADALRRGRLRLVRMPVFDAQPGTSAAPHLVQVSAGGYTTTVPLSAQPASVTLPVGPVGTVLFSAGGASAVAVGALTLNGPVRFPDLPAGQTLEVGVIAQ